MTRPATTPTEPAPDSHTTFFRQGSWLVLATGLSGLLMMATQMVAQRHLEPAEYTLFYALLRVYLLFGVTSIGLQTVFAQQTAAAVTAEQQALLPATARAVLRATVLLWSVLALGALLFQPWLLSTFHISNPAALWATVAIGLASLWSPVLKGVVQGRQHFLGLGWSMILDGAGRFLAVLAFTLLGGQAAGGMAGALMGQVVSTLLCVWLVRDLFRAPGRGFVWGPWLRRVLPLTLGTGTLLLMSSADVLYVQILFSTDRARLYVPAAMIGLALSSFAGPLAAVMFPKVARSAALTRRSRAMPLALAATASGGVLGAVACTLFPELPLRVIFFRNPVYWEAAPLVPWMAWAILPLIVANVLVNNLLAQGRFRIVPWVLGLGALYLAVLIGTRDWLPGLEAFRACRTLLGILGVSNLVLLGLAVVFTVREPGLVVAAVPSV